MKSKKKSHSLPLEVVNSVLQFGLLSVMKNVRIQSRFNCGCKFLLAMIVLK